MFTHSCYIRKNVQKIKDKLLGFGYKEVKSISKNKSGKKYLYCSCGKFSMENYNFISSDKNAIYCEDDEELFLAIAALNDNSDKNQWFVNENNKFLFLPIETFVDYSTNKIMKCRLDMKWHKASIQELIKYFNEKKNNKHIMKNYRVLFADLDSTLIETVSKQKSPEGIWDMKFKLDVLETIKKINPDYLFIVTNQDSIPEGFTKDFLFKSKIEYISFAISEYLQSKHVKVDYMYCATTDKNSKFRKPNVGMLEKLVLTDIIGEKIYKSSMLMISGNENIEINKQTAENYGIDYMSIDNFISYYK